MWLAKDDGDFDTDDYEQHVTLSIAIAPEQEEE